jgi:alpha-ketoglutarate-dependent taurine dioxygenase
MIILLILILAALSEASSFSVTYVNNVPFIAEIKDIDINEISPTTLCELKILFSTIPVLVFKNQSLTPENQFEFCKNFDPNHTNEVVHPFKDTQIPATPQIALRGKGFIKNIHGVENVEIKNSKMFKYNKVWHQDLVGTKGRLPTVVSSMYMIETPDVGGSTLFCSLEKGYENMMDDCSFNRLKYSKLMCCYSTIHSLKAEIDYTGYGRTDKYWSLDREHFREYIDNVVVQPLVVNSHGTKLKKSLMISPNKFYSFLGMDPVKSQEILRNIMRKYVILDKNTGEVKYDKGDLLMFNNRRVIHTSTPTEEICGTRIFSLLFLDSKENIMC